MKAHWNERKASIFQSKKCHTIRTIVSYRDFNYKKINPIKSSDWIKLNYQKKKKNFTQI